MECHCTVIPGDRRMTLSFFRDKVPPLKKSVREDRQNPFILATNAKNCFGQTPLKGAFEKGYLFRTVRNFLVRGDHPNFKEQTL